MLLIHMQTFFTLIFYKMESAIKERMCILIGSVVKNILFTISKKKKTYYLFKKFIFKSA